MCFVLNLLAFLVMMKLGVHSSSNFNDDSFEYENFVFKIINGPSCILVKFSVTLIHNNCIVNSSKTQCTQSIEPNNSIND